MWRSAGIEEKQHQSVLKVLVSISDRNCQQCGIYFKNITSILAKSRAVAIRKGNDVEFFEKELIDRAKF
jgi:hypothetical protein